jgi:hypothetical protein
MFGIVCGPQCEQNYVRDCVRPAMRFKIICSGLRAARNESKIICSGLCAARNESKIICSGLRAARNESKIICSGLRAAACDGIPVLSEEVVGFELS